MAQERTYQQCTRCVMDTTDSLITFDEQGQCNHCADALSLTQNLVHKGEEGQRHLEQKLELIRKRNKKAPYDVISGISGGVDSSYVLIKAKELGLRVLAVHCDTGWNSEEATNNIHQLVNQLGFDLETTVVPWEGMREVQKSLFKASVPNCDIPQDHAIYTINNKIAKKVGVKDFLSGGNVAGESILPNSWGHDAKDIIHIKAIHKQFGKGRVNIPSTSLLYGYLWGPFFNDIGNYRILNDIDYNPITAKQQMIESYGWKDYGGKHHESVFTRFFQAYYLPTKFGFDKRKAHLSSLIVAGIITRAEAIEELNRQLYDSELLRKDTKFFIKKMGFTSAEWEQIMNTPPELHTSYKTYEFYYSKMRKLKNYIEGKGITLKRSW